MTARPEAGWRALPLPWWWLAPFWEPCKRDAEGEDDAEDAAIPRSIGTGTGREASSCGGCGEGLLKSSDSVSSNSFSSRCSSADSHAPPWSCISLLISGTECR